MLKYFALSLDFGSHSLFVIGMFMDSSLYGIFCCLSFMEFELRVELTQAKNMKAQPQYVLPHMYIIS